MSATGRVSARMQHDVYPTDERLARALVGVLVGDDHLNPNGDFDVLEPSAGSGSFVRAIADILRPKTLVAVDLRETHYPQATETIRKDFLEVRGKYDLICGNPPFSHAERHIRHGMNLLEKDGTLAFVLRLAFLESLQRAHFWRTHPPDHIYALRPRPSFRTVVTWALTAKPPSSKKWMRLGSYGTEDEAHASMADRTGAWPMRVSKRVTKNDSTAYGFFVWRKSSNGLARWPALIEILDWRNDGKE